MKKILRLKEENKNQFTEEFKPVEIEIPQPSQKIITNLSEMKEKKRFFEKMIESLDEDILEVEKILNNEKQKTRE